MSPGFISPELAYGPNSASLTISQTATFDSVAETANQQAAAKAVEALDRGHGVWDAVILLEADEARSAFDQLSGEVYASVKAGLIDESRPVRESMLSRLRTGPIMVDSNEPAGGNASGVWAEALGAQGSWQSDGNAAGFRRSLGGLLAGWESVPVGAWRFGVLAGGTRGNFAVRARGSEGSSDTIHLGAYGQTQAGPTAVALGAAYASHKVKATRSVAFPGFTDQLSADFSARATHLFSEVRYPVGPNSTGGFDLEPFAAFAWARLQTEPFAEEGGDAALVADASVADVSQAALGLRMTHPVSRGDTRGLFRSTAGWLQALDDGASRSALRFPENSPFSIAGVPAAQSGAFFDAALDFELTPAISLQLTYSASHGTTSEQRTGITLTATF